MKKKTIALLICAVVLLSSGVTYLLTMKKYEREIDFCRKNADLLYVHEDIKTNFFKEISDEQLLDYMIKGCIDACDEQYTTYKTANILDEDYVNNDSSVSRSGFAVDKNRHDLIVVTKVDEGSRAEEMGLQVGDIITSIDGEDVLEKGYYKAIRDLLGKDGTKMMLHIKRGMDTELDIEFTRCNVVQNTEKYFYHEIMNDDILYIRFSYFDANTNTYIQNTLKENEYKSVILDVRNNHGGMVDDAVKIFDLFAGSGSKVVRKYTRIDDEHVHETTDGDEIECPVVVLVNEKSISSAEILSLLFKDTGRGTLIGEKTFGKGIFQIHRRLSNMLTYCYTAGYIYVNDAPNYDGIGVYPDITIEMDEELMLTPDDIQLKKALEILG